MNRRLQDIPGALAPLLEFAKEILKDYEEDWKRFPIFLKATAGMRQLSYTDREAVLAAVRDYLGNPETCPFFFQFDHARVISGEEVRGGMGLFGSSICWLVACACWFRFFTHAGREVSVRGRSVTHSEQGERKPSR